MSFKFFSTSHSFGNSDFLLLEEADTFLAIADDPTSPEVDEAYYDPEGNILLLESLLNSDLISLGLPCATLSYISAIDVLGLTKIANMAEKIEDDARIVPHVSFSTKQIREPAGKADNIVVCVRRGVTSGIRATPEPFEMVGQTSSRTMSP
ncbi:hypothetical protein Tco_0290705 [Tanacetum coccineum]